MLCPSCGHENPQGQRFCGACGHHLGELATPTREVRKTVTVVFCDITGSTALGEQLEPEALRDIQSRYFNAMRSAIEDHGGKVEKYIGDAVMAVFGIPQLHDDDALRAARAANDMREKISELNKGLERDRGVTIEVRIGVNTGEVVTGDQASSQAFVTGDAVNTAARLEQLAEPGDILLGDLTHRLVTGSVEAQSVDSLDLKGKTERVTAWRLKAIRDPSSTISRRFDSPMVGRESQLGQLQQALLTLEEHATCRLFTILGEAGIGKSRLVHEFVSGLEHTLVLHGRCLPYGQGITYFPVIEAIKQAVGLASFDLPDVITERVRSALVDEEHQELICRHVSQLLGADETVSGDETFWAIRRFFEAMARVQPLVLVLDDIHWGEPTLLDLIEHIGSRSRGASILLLCIARPQLLEKRPTWVGKSNADVLSLDPLPDDELVAVIDNLLGSVDLPAPLTKLIMERAEGNPLFIEQVLDMLVDERVLQRRDGEWVAQPGATVEVPPTIQVLLSARIDALGPPEREVLECAAVIGQEFLAAAVYGLMPGTEHVHSHLLALVGRDLISQASALRTEDAFRFRHILVRDAAYDSITKTRRAELHEGFADWLLEFAGEAVAEQEEIVAYHLEQARAYRLDLGPPDDRTDAIGRRAAAHLASPERRAADRGDWVAAANLLRRALAVVPQGDVERVHLLYRFAVAMEWFDVKAALEAFAGAQKLARKNGDRSAEWRATIGATRSQMDLDPHSVSTERFRGVLQQAGQAFESLNDEWGMAIVWNQIAALDWMPCRYAQSERAARRAVESARFEDRSELTTALGIVISSSVFGPATPEEGLATLEELRDEISRDLWLESWGIGVEGYLRGLQGNMHEARRLLLLARERLESIGFEQNVGLLQLEGDIELRGGDPVTAERISREAYDGQRAMGYEAQASTQAAYLASTLVVLGRHDEAEQYAEFARGVAAEDDLASQVGARSVQALILTARGRLSEADRLSREALELCARVEAPNMRGDTLVNHARVLVAAGETAGAKSAAREALGLYESKGNQPSIASTRALIKTMR